MRQMTKNTVEHVVETTSRSYEQVKASLETQMNVLGNTDELMKQLVAAKASWDQVRETIEKRIGPSGFTIFGKVEQGQLLSLAGKPRRVIQYAVGNPFLAIRKLHCMHLYDWQCMKRRTGELALVTIGSHQWSRNIRTRKLHEWRSRWSKSWRIS